MKTLLSIWMFFLPKKQCSQFFHQHCGGNHPVYCQYDQPAKTAIECNDKPRSSISHQWPSIRISSNNISIECKGLQRLGVIIAQQWRAEGAIIICHSDDTISSPSGRWRDALHCTITILHFATNHSPENLNTCAKTSCLSTNLSRLSILKSIEPV